MNEIIQIQNQIIPTKAGIEEIANTLIQEIKDGNVDPLKAHIQTKALIKALEKVQEETLSEAITEAEKYGKEGKVFGVNFRIGSSGDRFDYEQDQEYVVIKDKLKYREDQLKMAAKMNEELVLDGVLIPKVPLKSLGKTNLTITIK
jgi:hypothetical protein